MRCVYSLSSSYALRPRPRQDPDFFIRYIKQSDAPTWTAYFYDDNGVLISPSAVTLTVNYLTPSSGIATDVLPMTRAGEAWSAQWANAGLSVGRSTATWSISTAGSGGATGGGFSNGFSGGFNIGSSGISSPSAGGGFSNGFSNGFDVGSPGEAFTIQGFFRIFGNTTGWGTGGVAP